MQSALPAGVSMTHRAVGVWVGVRVGVEVVVEVLGAVGVGAWMVTEPSVRLGVTLLTQLGAKNCVSCVPWLNSKVNAAVPGASALKLRVDTRTLPPFTGLPAPTLSETI